MPAPGYVCPACGRRFSRRPTEHTCARFELGPLLDGKAPHVVKMYHRLVKLARSLGSVQVRPLKTTIAIAAPSIMANLTPQKQKLKVLLVLPGPFEHRTLKRRQPMSTVRLSHEFSLAAESDLDGDFEQLVREAYDLASGE